MRMFVAVCALCVCREIARTFKLDRRMLMRREVELRAKNSVLRRVLVEVTEPAVASGESKKKYLRSRSSECAEACRIGLWRQLQRI